MRKQIACVLAAMLIVSLFCGCGNNGGTTTTPAPTMSPAVTDIIPTDMMPDVSDGIVTDEDGIIDDNDTGKDKKDDVPVTDGVTKDKDIDTGSGKNDMENNNTASPQPAA